MSSCVNTIDEAFKLDFSKIEINEFWNTGDSKELKIHRIHAYPAKFPAFITKKALDYAQKCNQNPRLIADIFCGCGTVAFEAKRNNIDFWGCDINPVATLIAKVKSNQYNMEKLNEYFRKIINTYNNLSENNWDYENSNERIKYWFFKRQFSDLSRLKFSIEHSISSKSKYYSFFLCAFSNILKPTSKWLTKSIKPQVDPKKDPADVLEAFKVQCNFMFSAYSESTVEEVSKTNIITGNFLDESIKKPKVDMIITSPPYVTSYEYADLHQLSSLWLEYTDDYRKLREGSVGSLHHIYNFEKEIKRLNRIGSQIIFRLLEKDKPQARSVTKYFLDMQLIASKCDSMLNEHGLVLFIIGDTEYKGIKIENAKHLVESLLQYGFKEVEITKRKISGKILTPFRDENGRFSNDSSNRKIYSEEFIVIGRK